jgi:hypothetical protein
MLGGTPDNQDRAMPNLSLDNYFADLRALALVVTDPPGPGNNNFRTQRAASTTMVDVVVTWQGGVSVTMLLREGGLYIKGFRNAHGTYYFKEDPAPIGGTMLSFGCSYIGTNSIGIYEHPVDSGTHERAALEGAVRKLEAYAGGMDSGLKVACALMVMLISESIRFKYVAKKMTKICDYTGPGLQFADVKDYVQNWQSMSTGAAVPMGTTIDEIWTYWGHRA